MGKIKFHLQVCLLIARTVVGTIVYSCKESRANWSNGTLWHTLMTVDARFYAAMYQAGIALGQGNSPKGQFTWFKAEGIAGEDAASYPVPQPPQFA